MSPLVSLSRVDVALGGRPIIDGLTLAIEPGATLGVTGPNGSGKTTLLRLLATLIRPTSGTLELLGWTAAGTPSRELRSNIGYVGHAPALNDDLSLLENLAFYGHLTDADITPTEALSMVGIDGGERSPAKFASQGMRRRADLARLLLHEPQLTILDEPHAGLDQGASAIVDALIERGRRRNGCTVIASHDAGRLSTCDQVITMGATAG